MHNRPRRWVNSGALRRLFESLTADPSSSRSPGVDRLHTRPRPPARGRGAAGEKTIGAERSAGAEGHGSRGGLTTKVIVTAADENTPLAVDVVAGGDTTRRF